MTIPAKPFVRRPNGPRISRAAEGGVGCSGGLGGPLPYNLFR